MPYRTFRSPAQPTAASASSSTSQGSPWRRLGAGSLLSLALLSPVVLSACAPQPSDTQVSPAATQSETADSSEQSASPSTTSGSAQPTSQAQVTVGALVAGFPTGLLPVMPGSQVRQSAYDSSQDPASASLVLTTNASAQEVTDFYTEAFKGQGFTALSGDVVGSVPTRDFVRGGGQESVSVSVVSDEGGSSNTVTLGAKVAPGSLKQ
ncbi:hypothetical protein ODZ83_04950 [Acaricomes phytoseiuli]|uniref:hypothetical protein n=1 Tax=Acaricomes phytoseiuli TaxID=291968 RepID=UPI00036C087F|nr:hypothetical protein [Acaricomes phytoseiuli]MCW1249539.1 hypothetical protein [Acaricomes phytoseiuli]